MTPKLKQQDGYTFKIFSNEEERKHIHVVKGDCEAKFWLEPIIELAYNYGFNNKEFKKIHPNAELSSFFRNGKWQ